MLGALFFDLVSIVPSAASQILVPVSLVRQERNLFLLSLFAHSIASCLFIFVGDFFVPKMPGMYLNVRVKLLFMVSPVFCVKDYRLFQSLKEPSFRF